MRLLIVEDEEDLANAIVRGLHKQGYGADVAYDGESGWELAEIYDYDLVVLDLGLPGIDGLEICQRLRATHPDLLIMMLTARSELNDRIKGLDLGADDYLVKPFYWKEFLARVRALLRREMTSHTSVLQSSELI